MSIVISIIHILNLDFSDEAFFMLKKKKQNKKDKKKTLKVRGVVLAIVCECFHILGCICLFGVCVADCSASLLLCSFYSPTDRRHQVCSVRHKISLREHGTKPFVSLSFLGFLKIVLEWILLHL